jgi:predicted ATPase
VETHSDHFVRRLRGLVARAPVGSDLERWLRENVSVVEVTRGSDGASTLRATALDERGGFEQWPADFMDAATDEEREI